MLTLLETIQQRRSIRSFRSDPVPDEVIHQMLESARLAPSGSNRQPWRFIVVTDATEKARLRQICQNQTLVERAPAVFVCCADLTAYSQASRKQRYQEFMDHGVMETLSGRVAEPDFWASVLAQPDSDLTTFLTSAVANTYIAIEHMVLTATALGLGTCWLGAFYAGEIAAFFSLPATTVAVAVLPVGYPMVVPPPRPRISLSKILLRPLSAPVK